jgi:carbon storage regulator
MLALTRRVGQALVIGRDIEVHVVRVEGDRVVLGVRAPRDVPIARAELLAELGVAVREAAEQRNELLGLLKTGG